MAFFGWIKGSFSFDFQWFKVQIVCRSNYSSRFISKYPFTSKRSFFYWLTSSSYKCKVALSHICCRSTFHHSTFHNSCTIQHNARGPLRCSVLHKPTILMRVFCCQWPIRRVPLNLNVSMDSAWLLKVTY